MENELYNILLIEDNPGDARWVKELLKETGTGDAFALEQRETLSSALNRLNDGNVDAVLLDLNLPDSSGMETFTRVNEKAEDLPVILLTGLDDQELALGAIKKGAQDYISKNRLDSELLRRILRYAIERKKLEEEKFRGEKLHGEVLKNISDAVLITDDNGRFTYICPNTFVIFGYSPYEISHMGYIDNLLGDNPAVEIKMAGEINNIEWKIKDKHGAEHCLLINAKTVSIDGGTILYTCRDVTPRKEAEEALRASQERLSRIVDTIPLGITIVGTDGKINFANPEAEKILGISKDEIADRYYNDPDWKITSIDGEDFPDENLPFNKVINTEEPAFGVEHAIEQPDGSRTLLSLNSSPLKDAAGNLIGVVSSIQDITEKKSIERLIRDLNQFRESVIDNANVFLDVLDENANVLIWNKAAEEISGYSRDEVIGHDKIWEWLYPDEEYRKEITAKAAAIINENEVVDGLETVILTKSGEYRTISWNSRALYDPEGNPNGSIAIGRDITEQKCAEQALRENEKLLNDVSEMARVGGWELDADTKVVHWTRETHRIHEVPEGEHLELSRAILFFDEPDRYLLEEAIKCAIEKGEPYDLELRFTSATGRNLWTRAIGQPVKFNGKVIKLKGTFQDITERKELQEKLNMAQRMESIGRLAGGVAHDFNNNLVPIMSISEMLLKELDPSNPLHEDMLEINEAGQRCVNLTRQLLAFGRKQILEMKVLDLNEVILNLEKMLRRVIGEDIELETHLADDLSKVKADVGQLEQVIVNFVVNARDAMPDGGRLIIETKDVYLDEEYAQAHVSVKSGHYVMMAITDTGEGMDSETLNRVFEPFFTTKDKSKGTGLGLATVYGIIKQSGGNIWAYSEPGSGTTFKIYLPLAEGEVFRLEEEKEISDEKLYGHETILLVEDDDNVRSITKRILDSLGYNVMEAQNGAQALEMCEKNNTDIELLLTDVVMPGMNGRELASALSKRINDLKVLYTSGYADESVFKNGILDEDVGFLQKPFTPESLARKIREILDE